MLKTKMKSRLPKYFLLLTMMALLSLFTVGFALANSGDLDFSRRIPDLSNFSADPIQAMLNDSRSADANSPTNCRYGVAPLDQRQKTWLETMGIGWFIDYNSYTNSSATAQKFNLIRIRQNRDSADPSIYLPSYRLVDPATPAQLVQRILSDQGQTWIIGNEPDRAGGQDDTYPEIYAEAYHDLYKLIKETDPAAQVAIAGLVQVTPGRLQYLDNVWEAYQTKYGETMPVDVWNAHIYILPETHSDCTTPNGIASVALGSDPGLAICEGKTFNDCTSTSDKIYCFAEHDNLVIFRDQVRAMRQWMKDNGQQNKPLIISEFGILFPYLVEGDGCYLQDELGNCFTRPRVQSFMQSTIEFFETATDGSMGYPQDDNKLVQQWLWFPLYHDYRINSLIGQSSDMLVDGYQDTTKYTDGDLNALNELGQYYRQEALNETLQPNLVVRADSPITIGSSVSTAFAVWVQNIGNTQATGPIRVTIYADANLTQVVGSAPIYTNVFGCGASTRKVYIQAGNLPDGEQNFWVKVDSNNLISETNEGDNVRQITARIFKSRVLLPVIVR